MRVPHRRSFLKHTLAAGAAAALLPTPRVLGANDDVRVAVVGLRSQGKAHLVIDCYIDPSRQYHGLVSRDLPAADDWSPVSGAFELPEGVQLMHCLVYQVGKGTSWFDDVRISSQHSQANLLGDSGFDGVESWRVLCRKKGEADWQPSDAVVLERFHNVIFLEPATEYEFRVRRVAPDGSVRAGAKCWPPRPRRRKGASGTPFRSQRTSGWRRRQPCTRASRASTASSTTASAAAARSG